MAQFEAMGPDVEVNGETVRAIVDGMWALKQKGLKILAKHGIVDPAPGQWYPQQAWLDAFKEISIAVGPRTLCLIGRAIPEHAQFPPAINGIEQALTSIDVAYHMNHRNGEIGHYHVRKTGERSAQLVCPNPYPCEFDRGIIEAMANRFKPADAPSVTVVHDDTAPCRKQGAASCTYNVSW